MPRSAEPDDAAALVSDWEHETAPKAVIATPVALYEQAGCKQFVRCETALHKMSPQCVPAILAHAELERFCRTRIQAAFIQIVACGTCCVSVQERVVREIRTP